MGMSSDCDFGISGSFSLSNFDVLIVYLEYFPTNSCTNAVIIHTIAQALYFEQCIQM